MTVVTEQDKAPIVVGFDRSKGSTVALKWAAEEAARRGAPLRVVEAWTPGEFGTDAEHASYSQEELVKAAAAVIDGAGCEWTAIAEKGSAAKVLLAQADNAQMLVVGSRGHGALAGLALGSVGIQVATHDGPPVVVIVRSSSR
jgi:nucleotide-binding universal stress UspA family protein